MNATLAKLASANKIRMASDLPPRPKPREMAAPRPASELRLFVDKMTREQRHAFKSWKPHALCLVGSDGPMSVTLYTPSGDVRRRIGHNRAFWPVRLARTKNYNDTVTSNWDRCPTHWQGTLARYWLDSDIFERILAGEVGDMIVALGERETGADLENGFTDVGPEFDLAAFRGQVRAAARQMKLRLWDDVELIEELNRRIRLRDEEVTGT